MILEPLFFSIGLTVLMKILCEFLWILKCSVSSPPAINGWACITGGSDGIGLGIAENLAKQGTNLILISRSSEKLQVAKSLLQSYPIQIQTFPHDLSQPDLKSFQSLLSLLKPYNISLFINCAGTSYSRFFHMHPNHEIYTIIGLNIWPAVFMTKFFPEAFIINVSSTSSVNPTPILSLYSATKAFVDIFSQIGYLENKKVLSYTCGFVDTEMTKRVKIKPLMIKPIEIGNCLFRCIGNVARSYGHWKHFVFGVILQTMPVVVTSHTLLRVMKKRQKF